MNKFSIISLLSFFLINLSCTEPAEDFRMLKTSADPEIGGSVLPQSRQYNKGDIVTLRAVPAEGYVFSNWSGDASGTESEKEIEIIDSMTVVGNFSRIQFELTVNLVGSGQVTQTIIKEGISTKYNSGTIVELNAKPSAGWEFKEWSGALIGTENPRQITIDKAKSVTATFIEKPMFKLSIVNDGQGSVSQSVVKAGSSNDYSQGTIVEVTANPQSGWKFVKWSGAVSGTVNPQQVTLDANKTVIAEYESLSPIVLDNDGITMRAKPGTTVGTTYEINGTTYTVVDNTMLKSWISAEKDLSTAITTLVTDMKELFKNKTSFNDNISSWDCSNVTTMEGMFDGAANFNKDISKWDTNKVTNMNKMFKSATSFNQDLSKWCVVNLSTEPTDFLTGSACSTENKPVWGTWPECPLIGEWELESWTNNTDNATQFGEGEKKCDDYPTNALKINGGKDDYGTYRMTNYTCFKDGSTMRTEIEDGIWTYNGTENQVKVGTNQQDLRVFNLSYTSDFNYFTVKFTDYDEDGSSSRDITEVYKRKQ